MHATSVSISQRSRSTFTPSALASSSPTDNRLIRQRNANSKPPAISTGGAMRVIFS